MRAVVMHDTDRREHPRLAQAQAYLRIAGNTYHTVEWSYGGFLVEDPLGHLTTGALVRIDGLIGEAAYRNAKTPHRVDIRGRVARVDAVRGRVALACLKLDPAAYAVLTGIASGVGDFTAGLAE